MTFFDLQASDNTGKLVAFSQFAGSVCLVVNTASKCGFTKQYASLQRLFDTYRERGFYVLAFPSNDFAEQEPGSDAEIKSFCQLNYGVSFPLFAKGPVAGAAKQPVYRFLTESGPSHTHGDPGWNFVKILINRQGEVVGRFSALRDPMSTKIRKAIEALF